MGTKKFSAAEVFFVITGHKVPKKILPKNLKQNDGISIIRHLTGETFCAHQLERVRSECKSYLLNKFHFLFLWDLGEDVWNLEGAIEYFYQRNAKKNPYFEVEKMPNEMHASIDPVDEINIIGNRRYLGEKIKRKFKNKLSHTI